MKRNSGGKLLLFVSDVSDESAATLMSETSVDKTQKTDVLASNIAISDVYRVKLNSLSTYIAQRLCDHV